MTARPDDDLKRLLLGLRQTYLAQAPERVMELTAEVERVASGRTRHMEDLRRLFHRLAGSGGSYGLPDVTAAAREGERLVKSLALENRAPSASEIDDVRSHVQAVAEAFRQARTDDSVFD